MAIQSASAKLYTGIRCWCVDKNISASLSVPVTIVANVRRLKRTYIDLFPIATVSLANQRYKTYGGGNVVNDGFFITGQSYKVLEVGDSDWNAIAGTTGITYVVGSEFIAANNGSLPEVVGAANEEDAATPDLRNASRKTGRASLSSWTVRSSLVCDFPTYIRIDIEKLGLPEGTRCIVQFEENWIVEDRGRLLPSGTYEYPNNTQGLGIPRNDNYVEFRVPYYGLSFMTSAFTAPGTFNYRRRPGSMFVNSAFTPVMTARLTRQGVIDLQSAFVAVIRAGEIVRLINRADFFVVAGRIGPAGVPYLEGNGYTYYNINGTPTGLGIFPGITRIRQSTATFTNDSTASLNANVDNLPFIVPLTNLSSAFTMTAQLDAFKGVGTPNLQAVASLTGAVGVRYDSVIPTMQTSSTVFCRTPVQGLATLTATSSITVITGAPLVLRWTGLNTAFTTGIVFKGPNIEVAIKWSDGVIHTVSGGTYNSDIADAPITNYYTRTHPAVDGFITAEITGNLSGFQMSRNGVDYINGDINGEGTGQLETTGTWYVAGRERLVACTNWGDVGLTNLNGVFAQCRRLAEVPTFLPNTATGALSMSCAFYNNVVLDDANLVGWNTSDVGNMSGMFRGCLRMRQPIGSWNTSNVTNMARMFSMEGHSGGTYGYSISFPNTNTLNWDVTNVSRANMANMFVQHQGANLQLSSWCVSHIATAPTNFTFQTTTSWPTARRPQWGTCP